MWVHVRIRKQNSVHKGISHWGCPKVSGSLARTMLIFAQLIFLLAMIDFIVSWLVSKDWHMVVYIFLCIAIYYHSNRKRGRQGIPKWFKYTVVICSTAIFKSISPLSVFIWNQSLSSLVDWKMLFFVWALRSYLQYTEMASLMEKLFLIFVLLFQYKLRVGLEKIQYFVYTVSCISPIKGLFHCAILTLYWGCLTKVGYFDRYNIHDFAIAWINISRAP